MAKIITESGMNFIADNSFHIEKFHTKLKGIKTVEFIRAKGDKLLFMEAKSSFPNPGNPQLDNIPNFQSQVNDICEKFIHSLNLYASIAIGVNEEFPPDFKPAVKVSLMFVLIFYNFEQEWCIPIKKALETQLKKSKCIAKIWQPTVLVINHEKATKRNLIIDSKDNAKLHTSTSFH